MSPIDKFWLDRELRDMPDSEPEIDPAEIDLDTLPKCPVCGYIIFKLTSPRCPECGNAIRLEDFATTPMRLEVERIARSHRLACWIAVALMLLGAAGIVAGTWGTWTALTCFLVPAAFVTVAGLVYRLLFGDEMHGVLLMLGFMWLATGLFLCAARWL